MSLSTPTTQEVSDNIIANLEATLNQAIPLLPKSFLRVLAKTLAAVNIVLWKYCGFIFLQMFVQFASNEETTVNGTKVIPLQLWGNLIGVGPPIPAVQADLNIEITVTNPVGTLPSGTQFIGNTNGVTYVTLGDVDLTDPSPITATVRAVADQAGGDGSGTIGNLDAPEEIGFANPTANVVRTAVVVGTPVTLGVDVEDTEVYRQRIIDRFQQLPQGGAYADYRLWSTEVANIINAYPYTGDPGVVNVYIESGSAPDGIPTAGEITLVKNSINLDEQGLATRRPVTAFVNVEPIERTAFDIQVDDINVGGDTALEALIEADINTALENYFRAVEPFIIGLSLNPRNDLLSVNDIISIVQQIVAANGGIFDTATFSLNAGPYTPISDYTLGEGEKAKTDTITVTFTS